jgi:glutathione S-transferase
VLQRSSWALGGRIDLEHMEVVPGRPNRAYGQSHNPLRKIPALVTDDGPTIYDLTVICEYLDDLAGGGIIIPRQAARRWRVLTNHSLAQGLCDSVILIRYETWLRPEALRWSSWTNEHWDKINSGLAWFDHNSSELDGSIDVAHLALGSLLGYIDFRWPENGWRDRFPVVSDCSTESAMRLPIKPTLGSGWKRHVSRIPRDCLTGGVRTRRSS